VPGASGATAAGSARTALTSPVYTTPRFETGDERYAWLNKMQAVMKGRSGRAPCVRLPAMPMDDWRARFQAIVASLDYPMYIVTAAAAGERAGCLVGFATQSSIAPRDFLVCLSRRNHTYRVACEARALAVHLPPAARMDLAELFGAETGDEVDKFARCDWRVGPEGLPILDGCPSWMAGRILSRHDLGDHVGFRLEVFDARHEPGRALTYRDVHHIAAGHAP
jgi:flavin reductase (DIM6/NTAB) family NADH-FMN oxidoreductase RutF